MSTVITASTTSKADIVAYFFFCMLCPKISTDQKKIALTGRHVFATLFQLQMICPALSHLSWCWCWWGGCEGALCKWWYWEMQGGWSGRLFSNPLKASQILTCEINTIGQKGIIQSATSHKKANTKKVQYQKGPRPIRINTNGQKGSYKVILPTKRSNTKTSMIRTLFSGHDNKLWSFSAWLKNHFYQNLCFFNLYSKGWWYWRWRWWVTWQTTSRLEPAL